MLIDSHAHLFWDEFQQDLTEVINRAQQAGVDKIIVPGLDIKTSQKAILLAQRYPNVIKAAIGLHPEECLHLKPSKLNLTLQKLERLIKTNWQHIVAIGEVGLDRYWPKLNQAIEKQKIIFRGMVVLAKKYKLPLIIHSRESVQDILEIVQKEQYFNGVFHCFSGDERELKELLQLGFKVSFCGNITWSKRVAKLVNLVPSDKLLIETDSPFMTPRNKNGQVIGELRNEPRNVRILAKHYSTLRKVSEETIATITTINTQNLFGL